MPKTPTYNGESPRLSAPSGVYTATLASIKEVDNKYAKPGEDKKQWLWQFDTLPSQGQSYSVPMYTGTSYGYHLCKLTEVLNSIYGHTLTQQELRQIDLDDLIGEMFKIKVALKAKTDGTGDSSKVAAIRRAPSQPPVPPQRPPLQLPVSPAPAWVQSPTIPQADDEEMDDWGTGLFDVTSPGGIWSE